MPSVSVLAEGSSPDNLPADRFQVGAVSFLNTVPLVYGMLHGAEREKVELSFAIPSVCAAQLESGEIDTGIVPVAEIARQHLQIVSDVGIAAIGAVRSILLFSKVPWGEVGTLAADTASRTSVQLARVLLREYYGATPLIVPLEPNLESMLAAADAALIIGDPALRISLAAQPYAWLDLAEVWTNFTGLPFVFAAWAARAPQKKAVAALRAITLSSYRFGAEHLADIVKSEYAARGITQQLADRYLRHHLHYELGPKEWEGLQRFLSLAGLPSLQP